MPQINPKDRDVNDPKGPMYEAARLKDWPEVFRLIDREGGSASAMVGYGAHSTLLSYASSQGNIAVLDGLCRRGASLAALSDEQRNEVIRNAASSGQVHVLEWLRQRGEKLLEPVGSDGRTVLHVAASRSDLALTEYALQLGADPNAEDGRGITPFCVLAGNYGSGTLKVMNALIDGGADINHVNEKGHCALIEAVGHTPVAQAVEVLLDMGADLDNPKFQCPLEEEIPEDFPIYYDFASYSMPNEEVPAMIEARRNLPTIDLKGDFTKASLFARDDSGYCALDNPATWRDLEAIADTLSHKGEPLSRADFLSKNKDGKTFFQRAIECRSLHEVLPVLQAHDEWMEPRDFVADDGKGLNPLGEAARDYGTIGRELFTLTAWQGKTKQELKQFHEALPEPLQRQVHNLHQLTASLSRMERMGGLAK